MVIAMWDASDRFNKIIETILTQECSIQMHGIEPDRVILGVNIYDILISDANMNIEVKFAKPSKYDLVIGLPITVDYVNKWLIKVCYGFEADGEQLLFPNVKD